MSANRRPVIALATSALLLLAACSDEGPKPRNLILFVPDGLRALQVSAETVPTMAALRDRGVNFANPHSVFPTFTMPNASAMGTGHQLGDTGVYGNTFYTAVPIAAANGTTTPFIEVDAVLGELNRHFDGNFISEEAILHAAYARGFSTAALGKHGPTLLFDSTSRDGKQTIIFDDVTGTANGIPLSPEVQAALDGGGLAARVAAARRQCQGRRRQNVRHDGRQRSAAKIFRRCRDQGSAADVQGEEEALRARVLVGAIPTAASTITATAISKSRPASTARPRSPRSRTPTTI